MQRVPVRIALDPKELAEHPLRVGLSMDAKVDVQQDRRPRCSPTRRAAGARRRPASSTQATTQADAEVRKHHRRQPRPARAGADARPRRTRRAAPTRRADARAARGSRRRALHGHARAVAAPQPAQLRRPRQRRRDRAAAAAAALVLGTIALSLATFMNVLDTSIANVSIPAISGDLGVSPSQGTWVITSFAVANAISVPLTGWLTQRFGQVRLFTASVLLFVIASWLCGLAPNIEHADRVPRAAGLRRRADDPAVADAAAVELSAREGRHRAGDVGDDDAGRAGGRAAARRLDHRQHLVAVDLLHQHPGRPVRRGASPGAIYRKRDPRPRKRADRRRRPRRCWCCGSAALQIMLDKGKELDWFNSAPDRRRWPSSPWSASPFFLVWELTDEHPVVDLRLFARRNFLIGHARAVDRLRPVLRQRRAAAAVAAAVHGLHRDLGRLRAGAGRHPRDPAVAAGRQERRRRSIRASSRPSPSSCFALVLWMRSHFNTQADFDTILIPTVIQGAAMAFFFIPLQAIILSGLPPDRMPAAAGLSNFVRITAGAIGTSIFTTAWENRADPAPRAARRRRSTAANGAATAALSQLGASGYDSEPGAGDDQPHDRPAGLHDGGRPTCSTCRRCCSSC